MYSIEVKCRKERELDEKVRSLCCSLKLLLNEGNSLNGSRETFDMLYARLKCRGVADPEKALDNFCALFFHITGLHVKYMSLIATRMEAAHRYSSVEKAMLERLIYPDGRGEELLTENERQFLTILFYLHLHNLRHGIYDMEAEAVF